MAAKLTYDTSAKLFILNSGVTSLDVKVDLYSDAKEDWKDNATLNKLKFPIVAVGGQDIGGGQTISPYYILRYGWKIRPHEADHELVVTGNVITDDASDPFVNTVGSYNVRIKYVVSSNSISIGLIQLQDDVSTIKQSQIGRWKINKSNNTLTYYDDLGAPLATFDLFDENGNPASQNVYERVPQ